jgi:hypothetical protein
MTTQKNRGKESSDDKLFGTAKMQSAIQLAVEDLSHLLSRGYAQKSCVPLVGNRYKLNVRQQKAIQGISASQEQIVYRTMHSLPASDLRDKEVAIDGFNALILLESLLSDAYLFKGADGFYRDLSSVHGSYKKVQQTSRAIELIADFYVATGIRQLHWYFDKPVSNSGKLKKLIEDLAAEKGYSWAVSLTFNPDKDIVASGNIAISSDAWILDNAAKNFNLLKYVIEKNPSGNIFSVLNGN